MASFFNLTLDTLAPAGLSIILNDGAQYATSANVTAKISVSNEVTTGYQMKIWGTKTAETEEAASWETYAATKSITLPAVTTSDNGKFLRVVNGAWAAVSISDANGVNF